MNAGCSAALAREIIEIAGLHGLDASRHSIELQNGETVENIEIVPNFAGAAPWQGACADDDRAGDALAKVLADRDFVILQGSQGDKIALISLQSLMELLQ